MHRLIDINIEKVQLASKKLIEIEAATGTKSQQEQVCKRDSEDFYLWTDLMLRVTDITATQPGLGQRSMPDLMCWVFLFPLPIWLYLGISSQCPGSCSGCPGLVPNQVSRGIEPDVHILCLRYYPITWRSHLTPIRMFFHSSLLATQYLEWFLHWYYFEISRDFSGYFSCSPNWYSLQAYFQHERRCRICR